MRRICKTVVARNCVGTWSKAGLRLCLPKMIWRFESKSNSRYLYVRCILDFNVKLTCALMAINSKCIDPEFVFKLIRKKSEIFNLRLSARELFSNDLLLIRNKLCYPISM